jgi:hypothetical protein
MGGIIGMRSSRIGRLIAGAVLVALLAGCGSSSGPGSDPVGTVKGLMDAVQAGQWDKLPDYACAAQKDEITSQFENLGSAAGSALGGLGLSDIGDALKISYANLEVKEKSRDGDTAVVTVSGKIKMDFNKDKLKELVKKAAAAQGQAITDEQIDMALGMLSGLGGMEQDMNQDMTVVNEGGKWLVCQ